MWIRPLVCSELQRLRAAPWGATRCRSLPWDEGSSCHIRVNGEAACPCSLPAPGLVTSSRGVGPVQVGQELPLGQPIAPLSNKSFQVSCLRQGFGEVAAEGSSLSQCLGLVPVVLAGCTSCSCKFSRNPDCVPCRTLILQPASFSLIN